MAEVRSKTIFIDIDGTIIKHHGNLTEQSLRDIQILPGVLDKFKEWDDNGYRIILVTGRRESLREVTAKGLSDCGLFWDQLIMGIGGGYRVLINDLKWDSDVPTAYALSVKRNGGLENIEI